MITSKRQSDRLRVITVPSGHPDYELVRSINVFFQKKAWAAGGPIPPALLHTERNHNIVRNIDIIHAIDIGYRSVEACLRSGRQLARTRRELDPDVYLALRVIHQCERMAIPQDYIGGLFLLYLELCERVVLL